MTTDYFQDRESFGATMPLPSPSDTPYATPAASMSRRSSRFGPASPPPASSPPPFSPDGYSNEDSINDESIPITDPRRFTPTLHASLVSEILSLRRELDSKHKFIDELETHLETTKTENDELASRLAQSSKENKSVKIQLEQLETGTLAALEELAKERDEMKEVNDDLKTKVDGFQNRIKTQEEQSVRVHEEWQNDKEKWDNEKRGLERRVHATETRLKIILNELEAQQSQMHDHHGDSEGEDNTRDSGVGNESDTASIGSLSRGASLRGIRHNRNMSSSSHKSIGRSYRFSMISGAGSEGPAKLNGVSLADELKFDEEDEEDLDYLELDSDDFPEHEMRARRVMESRQSIRADEKAKRILGLSALEGRGQSIDGHERNQSISLDSPIMLDETVKHRHVSYMPDEHMHNGVTPKTDSISPLNEKQTQSPDKRSSSPVKRPQSPVKQPSTPQRHHQSPVRRPYSPMKIRAQYVDTAIQYSPPPSPVRPAMPSTPPTGSPASRASREDKVPDVEASPLPKIITSVPSTPRSAVEQKGSVMVSTSAQTVEPPLSPPATPLVSDPPSPQSPIMSLFKVETASVSTQTEFVEEEPPRPETPPAALRANAPSPIPIPSIAIIPPRSAPGSPKEPRLPPGTKSIACQTAFTSLVPMQDSSMQTEEIRIDRRLAKLPPHLLPSAIRSRSSTPEPGQQQKPVDTGIDAKKLSEKMLGKSPIVYRTGDVASSLRRQLESDTEDRYPGNNDNGPLARDPAKKNDRADGIRRPFRTSSLFAGFSGASSDEEEGEEVSEDELPGPSASMIKSRGIKHTRQMASPPTPVPEDKEVVSKPREIDAMKRLSREISPPRLSLEKPSKVSKPIRSVALARQPSIRRSAMIQSGTVAHQRSRSPSLGSTIDSEFSRYFPKPPFPVPTRSSSRRPPHSKSEGSQSPTPRGSASFTNRFGGSGRNNRHSRTDSLRKVRSAAVIPRTGRTGARSRSRSPPLPSPSWESSQFPPLPQDLVTSPHYAFSHRHQLSNNTTHTANGSIGSSVQSSSVVDAIAATMVGEWMWKYVRRRKSFNVPESPHDPRITEDTAGGVRHRRWVWLSPYERSVMWSSKQPTSNTALLGKAGRKLTIQSVLDVPDNTPAPKSPAGQTAFNRSILILTPQRALKFTTVSRERHYLWLTALSFLAHSINNAPEVPSLPPPIPREQEIPQQRTATLRKAHIRDSVRLAKDKNSPIQGSNPFSTSGGEYGGGRWDQPMPDAADPPTVPRFGHGRKRSSTGPRVPPPTVYRSFSHNPIPSVYSTGSSDLYGPGPSMPPSVPSTVYNPGSVVTSGRNSEASSTARHNFFDAMGTVRMEAFVERVDRRGSEDASVAGSSAYGYKPRAGSRRRGNTQWSNGTTDPSIRHGGIFEDSVYDGSTDPFKGF